MFFCRHITRVVVDKGQLYGCCLFIYLFFIMQQRAERPLTSYITLYYIALHCSDQCFQRKKLQSLYKSQTESKKGEFVVDV